MDKNKLQNRQNQPSSRRTPGSSIFSTKCAKIARRTRRRRIIRFAQTSCSSRLRREEMFQYAGSPRSPMAVREKVNASRIATPGKQKFRVSGDFAQNRGLWVKIPDTKSRQMKIFDSQGSIKFRDCAGVMLVYKILYRFAFNRYQGRDGDPARKREGCVPFEKTERKPRGR